jgi:hypothetical protein
MLPGENHRDRVLTPDERGEVPGRGVRRRSEHRGRTSARSLEGIRATQRGEEPIEPRDPFLLRDVTTILIDCGLRIPLAQRTRTFWTRGARGPRPNGCSRYRPAAAEKSSLKEQHPKTCTLAQGRGVPAVHLPAHLASRGGRRRAQRRLARPHAHARLIGARAQHGHRLMSAPRLLSDYAVRRRAMTLEAAEAAPAQIAPPST